MNEAAEFLARRGLRPASLLAADRPHGMRLKYVGGCRCGLCRRANTNHENARARARRDGDWNGIVSAEQARLHIRKLSRAGIGRRSVAAATDISDTVLFDIRSGRKSRIRARTERKILAVGTEQRADRSLVPATRLWRQIEALRQEGFSKAEIARQLGYKQLAIQFDRRRVTARSAERVARLYRRWMT